MLPQIRLRLNPTRWETQCKAHPDDKTTIFAGIGYETGTPAERQRVAVIESLRLWHLSRNRPYSAVMLLPKGWGPNLEQSPPDPFWRDAVQLADELHVRLDRDSEVW